MVTKVLECVTHLFAGVVLRLVQPNQPHNGSFPRMLHAGCAQQEQGLYRVDRCVRNVVSIQSCLLYIGIVLPIL